MKKDITSTLSTPNVDFWATVEAEIRQLVGTGRKTSVVYVLTFIYGSFHGVSIPSGLSFSEERFTGPHEGRIIRANICAVLIWDDGPAAGKVIVANSFEVDDCVNTGKNDRKYWIILVKPEYRCEVVGRCKFWMCASANITSGAVMPTGHISDWSQWAWDAHRNQFGRYRLFQGAYEYEWRDLEPLTFIDFLEPLSERFRKTERECT